MRRLIGEFEEQSFTQIIFPHPRSDWAEYLSEAQSCFVEIIDTIAKYQKVLVVSYDVERVKSFFHSHQNKEFLAYEGDDTWARDCSAICVETDKGVELLDFTFNGWGEKFDATKDNLMTQNLAKYYGANVKRCDFVLEGGAIECNGDGILLTTSECMLNPNRNKNLTKAQITQKLSEYFGVKDVLYLQNGYLRGDDTDSHIDTLARFISKESIMYVQCQDTQDEHFEALSMMEHELQTFAQEYNFTLIPLPMCEAVYYEGERLPATYANFLFLNGAVLVPTYNTPQDSLALEIFKQTFPTLDVVDLDCSVLIRQHGSLHCVTMNFSLD